MMLAQEEDLLLDQRAKKEKQASWGNLSDPASRT